MQKEVDKDNVTKLTPEQLWSHKCPRGGGVDNREVFDCGCIGCRICGEVSNDKCQNKAMADSLGITSDDGAMVVGPMTPADLQAIMKGEDTPFRRQMLEAMKLAEKRDGDELAPAEMRKIITEEAVRRHGNADRVGPKEKPPRWWSRLPPFPDQAFVWLLLGAALVSGIEIPITDKTDYFNIFLSWCAMFRGGYLMTRWRP